MRYKIKQSSPWLFILTLMSIVFASVAILILILPKGQTLVFVLCFASFLGLAFYLTRYTATADIEITIDSEGFKRKWVRQFILNNRPDIEFKWSDIEDYVFQPDRQFDQFKLNLKNGTKFKFYHNSDHDNKDEFRKFLSDFIKKVELANSSDNDKSNKIKLGKTIYETTWGLVLAAFAIIIIIGLPILLIAFPTKKTQNYAMLGVSYIGAIYFVTQVYLHRQRRRNET